MATVIWGATGREVYPRVLEHVIKKGVTRSPRGRLTLDAGFTVIELSSPLDALPLGCGRALNTNIAAAEAVQLVGAFSRPDLLTQAAPGKFEQFMNGDGFHGSYGDRIRQQVVYAVEKLHGDPLTRRAVATLWHAELDNIENMNDYPCTLALQFQLEGDALCMNTVMRSNDAWLGLPYDMFQFTQLQCSVANSLGAGLGWYRHTAMSLHLYSEHVVRAERIHESDRSPDTAIVQGFGRHFQQDPFPAVMRRARRTTTLVVNMEETPSEQWYRDRFASYLGRDVDEDGADRRGAEPVRS